MHKLELIEKIKELTEKLSNSTSNLQVAYGSYLEGYKEMGDEIISMLNFSDAIDPVPIDVIEKNYNDIKNYADIPGPYYVNAICKNAFYITNRHTDEFVDAIFFADCSENNIERMREYAARECSKFNLAYQHGANSK